MVRRVAGNAAHVVLGVNGIYGVQMLHAGRMAGQASSVNFLGGMILENENFALVAGVGQVGQPGAVATLASLTRRAALGVQRGLPVGRLFPVFIDVVVARLANLSAQVL